MPHSDDLAGPENRNIGDMFTPFSAPQDFNPRTSAYWSDETNG